MGNGSQRPLLADFCLSRLTEIDPMASTCNQAETGVGFLTLIGPSGESSGRSELQQGIIAKAKTPRLVDALEFVVVAARGDWLKGLCSRNVSSPYLRLHRFR